MWPSIHSAVAALSRDLRAKHLLRTFRTDLVWNSWRRSPLAKKEEVSVDSRSSVHDHATTCTMVARESSCGPRLGVRDRFREAVNRLLKRRGKVWAIAFTAAISFDTARCIVSFVRFFNFKKHGVVAAELPCVDAYSSRFFLSTVGEKPMSFVRPPGQACAEAWLPCQGWKQQRLLRYETGGRVK